MKKIHQYLQKIRQNPVTQDVFFVHTVRVLETRNKKVHRRNESPESITLSLRIMKWNANDLVQCKQELEHLINNESRKS